MKEASMLRNLTLSDENHPAITSLIYLPHTKSALTIRINEFGDFSLD